MGVPGDRGDLGGVDRAREAAQVKRYPFWLMPPLFIGALGVVLWFLEPVHAGDNLERRRTQALETIAQTLKNRDT
jgi:hypothetical protein